MLKWTVTKRASENDSRVITHLANDLYTNKRQDATDITGGKCRRRSSNSRRRSSSRKSTSPFSNKTKELNKENCFTSTPIKSSENYYQHDILRDVSNLTPKNSNGRRVSHKRNREQYDIFNKDHIHNSPLSERKKKICINKSHDRHLVFSPPSRKNSFHNNYFKPFELAESQSESVSKCNFEGEDLDVLTIPLKTDRFKSNYYAPTLPTFEVEDSPTFIPASFNVNESNRKSCPSTLSFTLSTFPIFNINVENEHPPKKKTKIELNTKESPILNESEKINVSPLVKQLIDLRFSTISSDTPKLPQNNSSYINDLSLDKIVDAILETTDENDDSTTKESSRENTSMIVNLDPLLQERENELNETHEENLINIEHEKQISTSTSSCDRNSFDSGFSSTATKQYHDLGANFTCKCNKNTSKDSFTNTIVEENHCDKTVIDLRNPYNERSVDLTLKVRKRPYSTLVENNSNLNDFEFNKSNECDLDKNCTLKRQKCIRRRKGKQISDIKISETLCDVQHNNVKLDFLCRQLSNRKPIDIDLINKVEQEKCNNSLNLSENPFNANQSFGDTESASDQLHSSQKNNRSRTRRCLSFETSNNVEDKLTGESSLTLKTENIDIKGSMDLEIYHQKNELVLKILRCKDLNRSGGNDLQINAYVKVFLIDRICNGQKKRNGLLHRTAVHANSFKPTFNHTFRLPISKQDVNKRLQIEVWHRDRSYRRSEFLGCMSFTVKNVIKKEINGSYRLLPQSTGRCQNVPVTKQNSLSLNLITTNEPEDLAKMCENQSNVDDIMNIDDIEVEFKNTSNPALLNQHQKDADENLFLRYLELDPTEGPDAIPAATQRKATGNKNGRTPFTTTKKLIRVPKSGFGFSVVWTNPPRIERVEKGLPADKAGILPGDYIIFVDKHNVVTMPEIDILHLIKSFGNQITLELYRKHASRNNSTMSVRPVSNSSGLPAASIVTQHRPSTIGSITTAATGECSRRRLNLPQVTFTAEKPLSSAEEARKKAMFQLLAKEQHYVTTLQFAITRFVSALAERSDLITPSDHRLLFQNSDEILQITEDILDNIVQEDCEPQIQLLLRTYSLKLNEIISAYKRYCMGIKKADCILANKSKNSSSDFVTFLHTPTIPRRKPDITTFIHKPLEHYREVLKLFNTILSNTKTNQEEYPLISRIVHELQISYREMTAEAGLMEPLGEGRPLLSVQDVENRLVFTKCKPFVLSKPGRQWIFGGDLSRVEGRSVKQYWTLLFSDLILFAKVSRDRVLFIIEDPLPLADITDLLFNVRKKATEFRILTHPDGTAAKSPTVHCGPDLTRTPKKTPGRRCVVLRAPNMELKAVWQNLLQRQIFQVNAGMENSSLSSPLDSPDAPITSSVVTLQSADSLSIRRQNPQCLNPSEPTENQKQIDEMIEHKCKQLGKCSSSSKGNAIHLEQWMKGQLGTGTHTPEEEEEEEEPDCEEWTDEMLRKRTEELQLIDSRKVSQKETHRDELLLSDQSPSKSTSPESQVTVRSSPIAPESVKVCIKCQKTCLSASNSTSPHLNHSNNNLAHSRCSTNESPKNFILSPNKTNINRNFIDTNDIMCDDFGTLMLMGLSAVNPAASLVKLDPFSPVPKISVVPPTPNIGSEFKYNESINNRPPLLRNQTIINCNNNSKEFFDISPDDSPQDEEQPYHSLSSSNPTLRRFGTVSSLERLGSDTEDANQTDSEEEEEEEEEEENDLGIDNQAFNHSTIQGWTARAGAFVSQKMAFFEKLGEDYRSGTGFFEKYLKAVESKNKNGEEEELENSGATSGEEIWGTPTSGDLDEPLSPSFYDERCSPNGESMSSDNGEDTQLMMDELLMTPPIAGATLRGLLPRRTLEPLMEEDSDTYTTSSSSTPTERTPPSKQGNGTGGVADIYSTAVENPAKIHIPLNIPVQVSQAKSTIPRILRSDSYRHIIEEEDDNAHFFNRFKSNAKINIERSKGVKLFQIFYVKKNERKIHESFPEGSHLVKIFNKEGIISDEVPTSYSQKPTSPRKPKDKQMDGRFWRQLSRRRGNKKSN